MWIDDRGSEILPLSECRRLLALGAKLGLHGHVGIAQEGAPLILPVDYAPDGSDVILQVGEHLLALLDGRFVAFQVDDSSTGEGSEGSAAEGRWSVLVRGLVTEVGDRPAGLHLPHPRVAEPGHRVIRVRGDVVTGRRLRDPPDGAPRAG